VINGDVTQEDGTMSSNGIVVDKHAYKGVKSGGELSGCPAWHFGREANNTSI